MMETCLRVVYIFSGSDLRVDLCVKATMLSQLVFMVVILVYYFCAVVVLIMRRVFFIVIFLVR
jgi:hypothetical protein